MRQEYQLKIIASDTAHNAETILTIRVTDINDNPPVFQQPAYHATLPDQISNNHVEILAVNATDTDSDVNAVIRYALVTPSPGFSVGGTTGIVYANMSRIPKPINGDFQLTVSATDSGTPQLSSITTIRIHVNSNAHAKPQFIQDQYR